MEKVLIIGPDFFGYNESIKRAFEKKGFEVNVFNHYDGYKGLKNKLLCSKLSKIGILKFKKYYDEKLNRNILDTYNEFKPDIVVIIKGFQILKSTIKEMKNSKNILWMMDSIYRYPNVLSIVDIYDYKFMFENEDVKKLSQKGIESYFLPLAADSSKYFPQKNINKDIDILFIGSLYENRVKMFKKLINDFPNLNICIYGKYTNIKKPISYIEYINKKINRYFKNTYVSSEKVNDLYARSKICINLHHEQSKDGCNPRFYEILASKAFQLVDYNEYIVNKYGNTVDNFKNYEELKSKIQYYINNEFERSKKVELYENIIKENYFENRIENLLEIISS